MFAKGVTTHGLRTSALEAESTHSWELTIGPPVFVPGFTHGCIQLVALLGQDHPTGLS